MVTSATLTVLIFLASRCALASITPPEQPLVRVNLTAGLQTFNARCLDGSPPALYVRPGDSRFVVYFQGGGWCYSHGDCARRSKGPLGSSLQYPATKLGSALGGILSPDPQANAEFAAATAVWVPYCDGGSYSGDSAEATSDGLWFRGRANMRAVVSELLENHGLASASLVLIDGGSAGGLTTLLHADFFGSLLPADVATRFAAIGDAGWFRPSVALDRKDYTDAMKARFVVEAY